MGLILELAGLEESAGKACPPSTFMTFLGIEIDTVTMTCRVPKDKMVEIQQELQEWANKQTASKKMLQSLIGKLQFIAKCIPPGRIFIARMLDNLRKLKKQHHKLLDLP